MAVAAQKQTEYMVDSMGRLVPKDLVSDVDQLRDAVVRELVKKALDLQFQIREFKENTRADVETFVGISAEKYGVTWGGRKGNISLVSFDGTLRVQVAVSEHVMFDERLQAAKMLIDDCIKGWAVGSRDEIKALINDVFQVDKEGRLNTYRVLGLRRLDIKDERWVRAMMALSDSLQVIGSKEYIRIYRRANSEGRWEPVSLDVAGV